MNSTLDRIAQALELMTTPMALEILDGLSHGLTPRQATPSGTDRTTIEAAVHCLQAVGAVTADATQLDHGAMLTPHGHQLVAAFERIGQGRRPLV